MAIASSNTDFLHRIHLEGGVSLYSQRGDDLEFVFGTEGVELHGLTAPPSASIWEIALRMGLRIVGVDTFQTVEQRQGIDPPTWQALDARTGLHARTQTVSDAWSFIAHAGFRQKKARLFDLASRLSHQLRTCELRLRDLSAAYNRQRLAAIAKGRVKDNFSFQDLHTSKCYDCFQSFLTDACVLRDQLAEFYAWTWAAPHAETGQGAPTTLNGVLKALRTSPRDDVFGRRLSESAEEGGWLNVLGAYRNLAVHLAPLTMASGSRLVASCRLRPAAQGQLWLTIALPLPEDPLSLSRFRASGAYFAAAHGLAQRTLEIGSGDAKDALNYAIDTLIQLTDLANDVMALTDLPREVPTFRMKAES